MRVGIIAHGHPDLHPTASNLAAYSLFKAIAGRVEEAYFFSTDYAQDHVHIECQALFSHDGKEILLPNLVNDYFYSSGSLNVRILQRIVEEARRTKLNIIHFHNFLGFGLDGFFYLRRQLPRTRFIFTAHEYLSICAREGQLMSSKFMREKLCEGPTPAKCSMCMPLFRPAEFMARDAIIRRFFDICDAITAPSRFLAEKIADICGQNKIHVIPNVVSSTDQFVVDPAPSSQNYDRFAFFGQIGPYSGLDVFLKAANILFDSYGITAKFTVFGKFINKILEKKFRAEISDSWNIEFCGAYDSSTVLGLMSDVDWIVVPSTWWENAPSVIEEALCAGRPVICSNIGGMAEMVEDGISGLHFQVGSSWFLAKVMQHCYGNSELWRRIAKSRRRPFSPNEVAELYVDLYLHVLQ